MNNEKVACPSCNELIWIPVPNGKNIAEVSYKQGVISMKEWAHQKIKCSKCGNKIFVWFR